MTYAQRIAAKVTAALQPQRLELEDQSHRHAGHSGARPGGETHFRLLVVSDRFTGLSRLQRQRLVYGLLASELAERVHALELVLRAPGEAAQSPPTARSGQ